MVWSKQTDVHNALDVWGWKSTERRCKTKRGSKDSIGFVGQGREVAALYSI
jgi:hypothetical protein